MRQKTGVPGVTRFIIRLAVLTQYWLVTDTLTATHTDATTAHIALAQHRAVVKFVGAVSLLVSPANKG